MLHLEFEGDVLDSSGNSYDGTTSSGGIAFVPGMVGMAASFSGIEEVFFQDFPDSNFSTGNFSLTYWFNTPIDGALAYVAKLQACSVARSFDNRSLESGELMFRLSNGQQNFDVTTTRTAGWHHLVAVRDDTKILLYLDGALRDELAIPPGMDIQSTGALKISGSPCIGTGEAAKLIGELDDLRIYSRVLSPEEIAAAFRVVFADGFEEFSPP